MDCESAPLRMLIFFAYGVQRYQVIGPAWMDSELYDIKAKIAAGASRDQMKIMLRTLLEERFHLAFHRETRQFPIFRLIVGNGGPKIRKSVENDSAAAGPSTNPGNRPQVADKPGHRRMKASMTLDLFAQGIGNLLGSPVVNDTGLTGKYDISLDWLPEERSRTAANNGEAVTEPSDDSPTLAAAIQEQLGLKLQPAKGQIEVLIIDHADKVPLPN